MQKLKDEVLGKQAALRRVYQCSGHNSLFAYANNWRVNGTKIPDSILGIAARLWQKIYPKEVARAAALQLQNHSLVSTIDHHGILNHPFFINSNLIFSLRPDQEYLICLSTAGISLNNSSWPASLVLAEKNTGQLRRFSFFPDKQKTRVVLAAPALDQQRVQSVLDRVSKDKCLAQQEKNQLCQAIGELLLNEDILRLPDFSSQASAVSAKLWQKTFPRAPKVLYLPVEDLVAQIIIEEIGKNSSHVLHSLLFTSPGHGLIEKYFQGSLGAFSSSHKGSFLFWGINEQGRRVHLRRQGFRLRQDYGGQARNKDQGLIDTELLPESISEALAKKQLYPSSLVCFLVLLYYGFTCLGGFNQVNWLSDIKEKFVALLAELGDGRLAKTVAGVPTDNFAEGNLAFLRQGDKFVKATGVDILLAQDPQLYQKYLALARQLTVGESIESLLPEIYQVTTPANERKDNLLMLTDELIARRNGMEEKIKKLI